MKEKIKQYIQSFKKLKIFGSLQSYFESKSNVKYLLVFVFFVSVFSFVYMSLPTVSTGDDHFFHIRFAEVMREKGIMNSFSDFKAIFFSKMAQGNNYFVYYNFFFYLALIPFTYIYPLFLGIKLYAIFIASLSFTILYIVLKKLSLKNPFLWVLFSFAIMGVGLIHRFFLSRPYTLAPVLLLILLYFLFKKKYLSVALVTIFYLYWHSATFYFPLLVLFSYFIFQKFYGEKGDYKNLLYGVCGFFIGLFSMLLVSKGFLTYMTDIIFGIYKETIIGKIVNIPEGNELYKADFFDFIKQNSLIVGAFFLSLSMFVYRYIEAKRKGFFFAQGESSEYKNLAVLRAVLFFLSLVFFLGTISLSLRFQDFFVFFSAVFVCFSLDEVRSSFVISNESSKNAFRTGVLVVLFYYFFANLLFLHSSFASGPSPTTFEKTGQWLEENVDRNTVVFYPTWNWFPQLYYHAPNMKYVLGLEPRFLYDYDNDLYFKWAHISGDGVVCGQEVCDELLSLKTKSLRREDLKSEWFKKNGDLVANTLINDFKSNTIVSSENFTVLNQVLDNSPRFERVFSDQEHIFIYKVK